MIDEKKLLKLMNKEVKLITAGIPSTPDKLSLSYGILYAFEIVRLLIDRLEEADDEQRQAEKHDKSGISRVRSKKS